MNNFNYTYTKSFAGSKSKFPQIPSISPDHLEWIIMYSLVP